MCVCVFVCLFVCLSVWLGGWFCVSAASSISAPVDWGDRMGLKLCVGSGVVCVVGWVGCGFVVVVVVVWPPVSVLSLLMCTL